ncbi:putative ribokinase [Taxawa tesnikishii (nom. ined.)]|nr:putative ribokinase [Dothideales sp. JES 119]
MTDRRAIAVIGSLNVDFITRTPRVPAGGETLTASSFDTGFGGKGANQAVACGRLSRRREGDASDASLKVYMVGAVGEDSFGTDFISALGKDGIDTTFIKQIPGQKTGIANIIVEEGSGENRILLATNANHASGKELLDLVPAGANVFIFQLEIPLPLVIHNIKLAHTQGGYVILNPAPAQKLPDEVYPYVDCLIMNETETEILLAEEASVDVNTDSGRSAIAQKFFAIGVKDAVIITLGSKGVWYATRSSSDPQSFRECAHVAARKVQVLDTTAAGDTFVGAYAVRVAQSGSKAPESLRYMIEFANAAAARTVEKAGAMAAIPWLDEVDKMSN